MSVINGFVIILMLLLLAYTFYRLIKRKNLLMMIPACFQIFSLSIAIPAFIRDVDSIPAVQAAYVLLGIATPAAFIFRDYCKMIGRMKSHGVYNGLVEAVQRAEPCIRCLPLEGINQQSGEIPVKDVLKDLKWLPDAVQKNIGRVLNHARSLISRGEYNEAFVIYDTLSNVAGSSRMLYYNLAGICYRMGKYNEALEAYNKSLELSRSTKDGLPDLYYNMGNACFMLKKFDKAAEYFQRSMEVNPLNLMACENLAFTYVHMGEKEKGIELLKSSRSADSGYRSYFIAGKLLYDASRYQEAEEEFKSCLKLMPDSIEAREELGRSLIRQNKPDAALEIYDEIVRLKPDEYTAWSIRANLCGKLKRWRDSADSCKKAISLKPDDYRSYYNMAVALEECGEMESAIEAYRNAIRINPAFADAYNNLGIALSMEGRSEEALETYEEGIRENPQNFSLFFNMGMSLFEAGRYVEAAAAYRNALDINPEELEVYYCLGAALTELRHYNDAIEAYKCALKVKPADGELHYNIAAAYAMLGRYDIAGENLKQAIALKEDIRLDARKNKAFDGMRGRKDFNELILGV